jgi:crotonobetainyl-CoA:carnitine CoA-transferase CaiB-like acyl-CoA transferase
MSQPLAGVRVIEVASWVFVPAAAAVLADWGADVIKIEHPASGDPQRGLVVSEYGGPGQRRNPPLEQANRGKRSVAVDLAVPEGLDLLYKLVAGADVFLTNFLPQVRTRLKIDEDSIRQVNPGIVYAKGDGYGPRGPDANTPGFDGTAYLARGAVAHSLRSADDEWPVTGTGGQGDMPSAMTLAGGIAAGLFERERTGRGPRVDVSLLGTAMWSMAPGVVAVAANGLGNPVRVRREENMNPLTIYYRLKDGRYIKLSQLQSDRFFAALTECLGVPGLAADERFRDSTARAANRAACVAALDEAFGRYDLDELRLRLEPLNGPWSAVQSVRDLVDDPQVHANGYLMDVVDKAGEKFQVVAAPVQFDEYRPEAVTACPGHGEHTDEVLLGLGLTLDELLELKVSGAVL